MKYLGQNLLSLFVPLKGTLVLSTYLKNSLFIIFYMYLEISFFGGRGQNILEWPKVRDQVFFQWAKGGIILFWVKKGFNLSLFYTLIICVLSQGTGLNISSVDKGGYQNFFYIRQCWEPAFLSMQREGPEKWGLAITNSIPTSR